MAPLPLRSRARRAVTGEVRGRPGQSAWRWAPPRRRRAPWRASTRGTDATTLRALWQRPLDSTRLSQTLPPPPPGSPAPSAPRPSGRTGSDWLSTAGRSLRPLPPSRTKQPEALLGCLAAHPESVDLRHGPQSPGGAGGRGTRFHGVPARGAAPVASRAQTLLPCLSGHRNHRWRQGAGWPRGRSGRRRPWSRFSWLAPSAAAGRPVSRVRLPATTAAA